jgi:uncharacterized protein (DUF4415 family)
VNVLKLEILAVSIYITGLPRTAHNPKTGAAVKLPAKVAVHFKPGKGIKDRLNAARDQCKMMA